MLKQWKVRFVIFLGLSLGGWVKSWAQVPFEEWLEALEEEAYTIGIQEETFEKARPYLCILPRVQKSDHKQFTKKISFEEYHRFLKPAVLKEWTQAVHSKRHLLKKIGNKYGVDPCFIAAIWCVETRCGKIMGKENVLSALTTLSYEGRRQDFFRKELLAAFRLLERGQLDPKNFKGSWAGAMGQCQFMPTSFEKYALDEDGDGWPDIWNSSPDVFASIAHYFNGYGWKKGQWWGREVKVPKVLYKEAQENPELYEKPRSLKEWRKKGVRLGDGRPVPALDLEAELLCPLSEKKKVYLVYSNFKVIKEYNKSNFYALSVGLLADYFKKKGMFRVKRTAHP